MPITHKTNRDMASYTSGLTLLVFSAVLNSTGTPDTTLFRGKGVASLVYAASTGKFTVTLQDSVRQVVAIFTELEQDGTTPVADRATHGPLSNENAAAGGLPISFQLQTTDKAGTLANITAGRRVSIMIWMKNSQVGT